MRVKYLVIKYHSFLFYLIFSILFLLFLNAECQELKSGKLKISSSLNYQQQDFKWSIAGNLNGQNPNIYSELTWSNLGGLGVEADVKYNIWNRFYLSTSLSYYTTVSGSVTDIDYQGDNRTEPVFLADLESDKGGSFQIFPSIGYYFDLSNRLRIEPGIGYGIKQINFYLLNDEDPDLKSTYKSKWQGSFIYLSNDLRITRKINVEGNIAYYQVDYGAKANWNRVEEFQHPVSFKHKAKGYGVETELKLGLKVFRSITAFINGKFYKWSTGAGIDELYLKNGSTAKTKLNDATLQGFTAGIGVKFCINKNSKRNAKS